MVFQYSSSKGFTDDVTCIAFKAGEIINKFVTKDRIFPGERESLEDVRSFTGSFLQEYCSLLDENKIDPIILALNEAAANIIEHNYEKDKNLYKKEFFIEAGRNEYYYYFRLYYDGIPITNKNQNPIVTTEQFTIFDPAALNIQKCDIVYFKVAAYIVSTNEESRLSNEVSLIVE